MQDREPIRLRGGRRCITIAQPAIMLPRHDKRSMHARIAKHDERSRRAEEVEATSSAGAEPDPLAAAEAAVFEAQAKFERHSLTMAAKNGMCTDRNEPH